MTDSDLRELFHAAAPALDGPDPAAVDRAWRDGNRRRVGVRAAVVGSIAASAAVVTGVAMLDGPAGRVTPAPSVDSPTSTPTTSSPVAERAGNHEGAPVWWAPSAKKESALPLGPAPLPPVIDLDAAKVEAVGEPVVALFAGRGERAFALTDSDRAVEIDTSRLERLTDEEGNRRNPLSYYSLSSDRLSAFFIQKSSLEVLDFATGDWTSIDTPDWLAEGARWVTPDGILVPNVLGDDSAGTLYHVAGGSTSVDLDSPRGWTGPDDEPWGPTIAGRAGTAQAAFTGPSLVSPSGWAAPEAILVELGGERSVLAFDGGPGEEEGTRFKGCCLALGWFDEDTVLFSSSSTEGQRILAWDVGTPSVYFVSDIRGPASITALADLS